MFIHKTSPKKVKQEYIVNHGILQPLATRLPQRRPTMDLLKAILDYMIVVPTLIFIAPLMLLIALFIKLDSPGPIFYRRRVLGRDGREFDAFKFRTLAIGSTGMTRVGYLLRQSGLDELPQLFNVLRREMSLVGPRVITSYDLRRYGRYSDTLLTVLPGITGWWQINNPATTTEDEHVHLDMTYIYNWSIWLDMKILLFTIPAVLNTNY